ncbi:MAG: hypothetical protein BWY09_02974 [Candidatus Hydrogenedentes bacterium ADurb.Bin179]|nr:MAG: hypothetical protein BWY09_02974 [Candidatus Hydrogenedentes bacterium ADurb.Bin179]
MMNCTFLAVLYEHGVKKVSNRIPKYHYKTWSKSESLKMRPSSFSIPRRSTERILEVNREAVPAPSEQVDQREGFIKRGDGEQDARNHHGGQQHEHPAF